MPAKSALRGPALSVLRAAPAALTQPPFLTTHFSRSEYTSPLTPGAAASTSAPSTSARALMGDLILAGFAATPLYEMVLLYTQLRLVYFWEEEAPGEGASSSGTDNRLSFVSPPCMAVCPCVQ